MPEFLSLSTTIEPAPSDTSTTADVVMFLIIFVATVSLSLTVISTAVDMLYGGCMLAGAHPVSALFASPLETMNGWEEIADENPVVYEGFIAYYVKTDGWIYATTLRTTPEVESFLETLVVN